jgi:hypothetical protein
MTLLCHTAVWTPACCKLHVTTHILVSELWDFLNHWTSFSKWAFQQAYTFFSKVKFTRFTEIKMLLECAGTFSAYCSVICFAVSWIHNH